MSCSKLQGPASQTAHETQAYVLFQSCRSAMAASRHLENAAPTSFPQCCAGASCPMALHMPAGGKCQQLPRRTSELTSAHSPACALPGWRQRRRHMPHIRQQQRVGSQFVQRRLDRRRCSSLLVPCAYGSDDPTDAQTRSVTAEATGSELIRKELVLFLIQQVQP